MQKLNQTEFLERGLKISFWGPISFSLQIFFSWCFTNLLLFHQELGFCLAVILTAHINFIILIKFIYKTNFSIHYYKKYITGSGVTRLLDVVFYFLISTIFFGMLRILVASSLGLIIRIIIYEKYVFQEKY